MEKPTTCVLKFLTAHIPGDFTPDIFTSPAGAPFSTLMIGIFVAAGGLLVILQTLQALRFLGLSLCLCFCSRGDALAERRRRIGGWTHWRWLFGPFTAFHQDWTAAAGEEGAKAPIFFEDYFPQGPYLTSKVMIISRRLPGVFLALGILGTFVGLSLGLRPVRATSSPDELMAGLDQLMSGISTAFGTSILGIVLSLVWLAMHWLLALLVLGCFACLKARVKACYPAVEPPALMAQTLEALAPLGELTKLDEMKKDIKSMADNVQSALAQAMSEAVERHVAPQIARFTEALESFSEGLAGAQTEAAAALTEKLVDHLAKVSKDHYTQQMELFGRLETAQARWNAKVDEILAQQQTVSDRNREIADRLSDIGQPLLEILEPLDATAKKLEAVATAVEGSYGAFQSSIKALQGVAHDIRLVHQGLEKTIAVELSKVVEAAQTTKGLVERQQRLIDSLGQAAELFDERYRASLTQSLESVDRELAGSVRHITGAVDRLGQSIEHLAQPVETLQQVVHDDLPQLIERAERTVAPLPELTKRWEGLATEAVPTATRESAVLLDKLGDVVRSIERGIAGLERVVGPLLRSVQAAGEREGQTVPAVETLTEAVGVLRQRMEELTGSIRDASFRTEPFDQGLASLAQRQEDLGERLEAMSKTMKSLDRTAGRLTRNVAGIDKTVAPYVEQVEEITRRESDIVARLEAINAKLGEAIRKLGSATTGWFFRGRR